MPTKSDHKMTKKCVYTAILDNYDYPKEVVIDNFIITRDGQVPEYDYICFTNRPELVQGRWEVRETDLVGTMGVREIKMNPHKFLPEYDETLWLDGSIMNRGHLMFSNPPKDVYLMPHIAKDCYHEISRCLEKGKGDAVMLQKQGKDYEEEGVPPNQGFFMGGLIWRRKSEESIRFNEAWYKEWLKYPSRDQVSLYKVLQTEKIDVGKMSDFMTMQDFEFNIHKSPADRTKGGNIYQFTPSGIGESFMDYGDALNQHCDLVPHDEDWIIIRDQDTMFFPTDHRRIIWEATQKYPDTGIFGAYTNRIGLSWQRLKEEPDEETDILKHYQIAVNLERKYGSECEEITDPIAGFFMMFRKGTWKNIRFFEGHLGQTDILFDWRFSCDVMDKLKLPLRLIKGLYIFHFYRFHKHYKDVSHIFK